MLREQADWHVQNNNWMAERKELVPDSKFASKVQVQQFRTWNEMVMAAGYPRPLEESEDAEKAD